MRERERRRRKRNRERKREKRATMFNEKLCEAWDRKKSKIYIYIYIHNWPEARTLQRWRSPKVVSFRKCFFFFSLLAMIRSKMNRAIWPATKFIGPRFTATTNYLASSRECSTRVAAWNCATPAIVFYACPATFWKTYYTFDFVPRTVKTKDHISHWLLRFLCSSF